MAIEGYDLVMLGILAAAGLLGYFKGIVWQIAWIAGIAASTFVALRFSPMAATFVGQQPPWNRLIAMLALYVATSLVVWLLFRVVSGAIDAVHLSAFDHQLGLLFGLAKGALLCIVITFFAVTLAPGYRGQIVGSRSGRLVAEIITRADEFLPREVADAVDPFVKQFEDQLRAGDGGAPAVIAGHPSPLQAIWEGVTSATAWTAGAPAGQGTQPGQGPQASVGGAVPAATWGQPPAAVQPTAGFAPPAAPQASRFPSAPYPLQPAPAPLPNGQPPPAPQRFPVGAQSPIPIR